MTFDYLPVVFLVNGNVLIWNENVCLAAISDLNARVIYTIDNESFVRDARSIAFSMINVRKSEM